MANLSNVGVFADSPAILLAQAEKLNLTDDQKQQIRSLAEKTRRDARQLLTPEQQQQLTKAPEGRLTMTQVASLVGKEQSGAERGRMCPMCMRMMQQQRQNAQENDGESRE